jgi:hypothetical protein
LKTARPGEPLRIQHVNILSADDEADKPRRGTRRESGQRSQSGWKNPKKGEMAYYEVGRWPTTAWAWRIPARAELVL